jgi:hypothetical protein
VNAADFWTSLVAQDEARKRNAHGITRVSLAKVSGKHLSEAANAPLSAADRALALDFEHDFCVALNMLNGKSYEEAEATADEWVAEANETLKTTVRRIRKVVAGPAFDVKGER